MKSFVLQFGLLSVFVGYSILPAHAQLLNDECSSPTLLVATSTCAPITAEAFTATESIPAVVCNGFTATKARDVWFSFVATSPNMKVRVTPVADYDPVLFLFASCGDVELFCADNGVLGVTETMDLTGLIPGNIYYVRVYHYEIDTYPADAAFDICVFDSPAPPINNDCVGAIQLVAGTSCIPTTADAREATESAPATTCSGFESSEARDVWFRFTANNSNLLIKVLPQEGYDAVVVLYDVCNGTELNCSDGGLNGEPENLFVNGLTPGTEYIVRVYHYAVSAYPENAFFDICVFIPPPPPANDNCAGAILVQTNAGETCTVTTVNTEFATASTDSISCSQTSFDDDLWYKFVATTDAAVVKASNLVGFTTGVGMTLYSDSCGGQQSAECEFRADGDSLTFYYLVPGKTYYLRIFSALATERGTFDFCIFNRITPPPPVNDNCNAAISIGVGQDGNCTPINGSTYFADESEPPVNCGNGAAPTARDVWYQFLANAPEITVEVGAGASFDAVIEAYDACNGTAIACVDAQIQPGLTEYLVLPGLTLGATYYVRVYQYSKDSPTPTFTICAYSGVNGILGNTPGVSNIEVYPNPAVSKVTIQLGRTQVPDEVRVLDNSGRIVSLLNPSKTVYSEGIELDVTKLATGLYTIQALRSGQVIAVGKVQVMR